MINMQMGCTSEGVTSGKEMVNSHPMDSGDISAETATGSWIHITEILLDRDLYIIHTYHGQMIFVGRWQKLTFCCCKLLGLAGFHQAYSHQCSLFWTQGLNEPHLSIILDFTLFFYTAF